MNGPRYTPLFAALLAASTFAQLPPVPAEKSDAADQPRLFIAERVKDLGDILEGDRPRITWTLENRGNADLIIEHTRTTCGCTVVKLDEADRVIPPGESLELDVEFDSRNRIGLQRKAVTVYSNDPAEPTLKLEFAADVKYLYEMRPPSLANLGAVRRGDASTRTVEILPGAGRNRVEILSIEAEGESTLEFKTEPFEVDGKTAQRIHMTVPETAALGRLSTNARIRISVDGIERERVLIVRGEVVGALTWLPRVIDATRIPSPPGMKFAPMIVRSTDGVRFTITRVDAGPHVDVTIDPSPQIPQTQFRLFPRLTDAAPAGPFATTLHIQTSLLDQPMIEVPVFAIVAPPVEVEPPLVLLRDDGTPLGQRRRVKLQALPQNTLEITAIEPADSTISVAIDRTASARYRHLRLLDVELNGDLPAGKHETAITIRTNLPGAEALTIPVLIEIPPRKGRGTG